MLDITIDARSRFFFYFFFGSIVVSLVVAYVRYMVLEEYPIFITEETAEAYPIEALENGVVLTSEELNAQ